MLVNKAVQLAMLAAAAMLWETRTDAASSAFKVCGRKLGDIMSRVCHVYNSPSWDAPTVVEQPATALRRKRQTGGIADECCTNGCTWEQLSEYCSVSANSDILLEDSHLIADRSAEQEGIATAGQAEVTSPAEVGSGGSGGGGNKPAAAAEASGRREVGAARARARSGGYGRGRAGARRGRCWCRRKRRSGRRRADLMGNMAVVKNVVRAAPVVGTVSPLLTWGRTLNTDLPQIDRDRYAYVAVYST